MEHRGGGIFQGGKGVLFLDFVYVSFLSRVGGGGAGPACKSIQWRVRGARVGRLQSLEIRRDGFLKRTYARAEGQTVRLFVAREGVKF